MSTKIDKRLNIVIPIERGHVHSMPISRAIFDKYFLTISKTFSAIYAEGLGYVAGPRVAALLLKKVAQDCGEWDGEEGVANGLMNEIVRLSNVVIVDEGVWKTIPLYNAIEKEILNEDERSEVINALVFFTCASSMHRPMDLGAILAGMRSLWGGQTTSLACTAFAASLPILTPEDSTGLKATASSIPS